MAFYSFLTGIAAIAKVAFEIYKYYRDNTGILITGIATIAKAIFEIYKYYRDNKKSDK